MTAKQIVEKHLAAAAAELGLVCRMQRLKEESSGFLVSAVFEDADEAKALWNALCGGWGLKPEHYGLTFLYKNKMCRIIGCQPRRPKYPIEVNVGGTVKLFPLVTIKRALKLD